MAQQAKSAGSKRSAGIILFRSVRGKLEIMLVHPGGPFWAKKDLASWSIPKGEFDEGEPPLQAAKRELEEETGIQVAGDFIALTPVKQKSGKTVYAWAHEKDVDTGIVKSNVFEMEWPPRSGKRQRFPEIDKAEWFPTSDALKKIIPGQAPLINELVQLLEKQI